MSNPQVDHEPTRQIGWYLFSIMWSGIDECLEHQMVAEGVYGRPDHFGGPPAKELEPHKDSEGIYGNPTYKGGPADA